MRVFKPFLAASASLALVFASPGVGVHEAWARVATAVQAPGKIKTISPHPLSFAPALPDIGRLLASPTQGLESLDERIHLETPADSAVANAIAEERRYAGDFFTLITARQIANLEADPILRRELAAQLGDGLLDELRLGSLALRRAAERDREMKVRIDRIREAIAPSSNENLAAAAARLHAAYSGATPIPTAGAALSRRAGKIDLRVESRSVPPSSIRLRKPRVLIRNRPQALLDKQQRIQTDTHRGRDIGGYNRKIFLDERWFSLYETFESYSRESATSVNIDPEFRDLFSASKDLADFFRLLIRMKPKMLHWADFGGGLALPMRELARSGGFSATELKMTNVDLFDWESAGAKDIKKDANLELGADIFDEAFRPDLVLADFAGIKFPAADKPDVITMLESIQYLDDKLKAIVNAYNQLADDGILIISNEHRWPTWIRTDGIVIMGQDTLFDDFMRTLVASGIKGLAWTSEYAPIEGLRSLAIRKKPGTRLSLKARFINVWENPYGYIASYYRKRRRSTPPVKVQPSP